jgi:uncharacterized protein involved in exopolysaccharide biosynthesis
MDSQKVAVVGIPRGIRSALLAAALAETTVRQALREEAEHASHQKLVDRTFADWLDGQTPAAQKRIARAEAKRQRKAAKRTKQAGEAAFRIGGVPAQPRMRVVTPDDPFWTS